MIDVIFSNPGAASFFSSVSALIGVMAGGLLGLVLGIYLVKRPGSLRARRARKLVAAAKRAKREIEHPGTSCA